MKKQYITILVGFFFLATNASRAVSIVVTNPGFEDTSGQTVFNEFTFGVPAGWQIYDPADIHPSAGLFVGTLQPNGVDFFTTTAPEGDRVAILYNETRRGEGEYGFFQELTDTLTANSHYTLTVEVGNIASGFAQNGAFFNLDAFPGYRVEFLAGGTVISMDNNSLGIPEAEFATSTVTFTTGETHPLLGQALGIRLVSENTLPPGSPADLALEVDFDDVALTVDSIPEPKSLMLFAVGFLSLIWRR